jgi:ABC-type Fe3+/spermidine/putrescine transport system ATPase subunit
MDIPQPLDERHPGDPVRLVVRPEAIRLDADEEGFPAVVRRSTYLGELIEYDLEIDGQLLIATESDVVRAEVYPEGKQITISFHKDAVYCLPK